MKKWIVLIIAFALSLQTYAQEKVTLQQCFDNAIITHPLYAQKTLKNDYSVLKIENYQKDLFPQIMVNGKATWQNEVISIPFNIPGMDVPELSRDQYRFSLDINQPIYRGGIYQKQKELESLNHILEQLEVDKNLYYLKNDVKALFFNIILLDEQREIANSYDDQIQTKLNELKALEEEGAAIPSMLDGLKAEQININQQLSEIEIQRNALMANLKLLTSMEFSGVNKLEVAQIELGEQLQQRLEFKYMAAQQNKLEYSKQLIDAQKLPKVYAFASGGYGRPGFNYLSDQFSEFLMIGVNLQWKIFNWNKFNNQKKMLDLNISVIETQKQDFELHINIALENMMAEINKLEKLLQNDPEMIRLRKSVATNASNQLNQGVITTSAYIDELQKQSQAEINMKIHEIQLLNRKLDYLNILGKL